ncbi:TerB family tellurite resistance protein [Glaciecola siphonariae]|uniref:TerB family tellurite resistance protein n=1 Tax=Glaciecola siphonariae TaxID=521012 RepID=A0ABV9LZ73_9ALTE
MLAKLTSFFKPSSEIETEESKQKKLQEACATLLMEVMRADFEQTEDEKVKIQGLLKDTFTLSESELAELVERSEQSDKESTSVYPFTSLINEHYDYDQRVNLVQLMWKVAYADGNLDKYEDDIIRKVADLLYIRHSDFIKAKLAEAELH